LLLLAYTALCGYLSKPFEIFYLAPIIRGYLSALRSTRIFGRWSPAFTDIVSVLLCPASQLPANAAIAHHGQSFLLSPILMTQVLPQINNILADEVPQLHDAYWTL